MQSCNGRSEHVLDEHEPPVDADDDAIGCQQTMGDVMALPVKLGKNRRQLADELDAIARIRRAMQDLGEPLALDLI
jgi:hypothetical protein